MRRQNVKMIQPSVPEGAKSDDFILMLGKPNIIFRENNGSKEDFVLLQSMKFRQIRQKVLSWTPRNFCDGVSVGQVCLRNTKLSLSIFDDPLFVAVSR